MIILTYKFDKPFHVHPGDTFRITITDNFKCEVVIQEEIITERIIDFVASFRYADNDGFCSTFNLCGIFAESRNLPVEFRDVVLYHDLPAHIKENFIRSCNTKIR